MPYSRQIWSPLGQPIFSWLHRYISSFHFHRHYSRYTDVSELCKSNNVWLSYVKVKPSEQKTLTQRKQPAQQSTPLLENRTTTWKTNRKPGFVMKEKSERNTIEKERRKTDGVSQRIISNDSLRDPPLVHIVEVSSEAKNLRQLFC